MINIEAVGEGTSDRGERSLADFGRSWFDPAKGSLATVIEGSGSNRNKRSLEVSALARRLRLSVRSRRQERV